MNVREIASALAARRTVRITYSRTAETYSIDVVQGDEVLEQLARIADPSDDQACADMCELADELAEMFARNRGLDITRLDVD